MFDPAVIACVKQAESHMAVPNQKVKLSNRKVESNLVCLVACGQPSHRMRRRFAPFGLLNVGLSFGDPSCSDAVQNRRIFCAAMFLSPHVRPRQLRLGRPPPWPRGPKGLQFASGGREAGRRMGMRGLFTFSALLPRHCFPFMAAPFLYLNQLCCISISRLASDLPREDSAQKHSFLPRAFHSAFVISSRSLPVVQKVPCFARLCIGSLYSVFNKRERDMCCGGRHVFF